MSIRRVQCPSCHATANIPAGMAKVRCSSCGSIWNPNDTAPAQVSDAAIGLAKKTRSKSKSTNQNSAVKIIAGGLVGVLGIGLISGGVWYLRQPDSTPTTTSAVATQPATPATPLALNDVTPMESYREVDLPESTRQQIYRDYRTAKGSSVGKPIPMPKQWDSRQAVDATLSNVLDRELTLHASIHNIQVDDVVQIIKEGNAKEW